ncbi:MAG: nicotinamide riboside transporter PnuC, partial [Bacteroidota bacterium]
LLINNLSLHIRENMQIWHSFYDQLLETSTLEFVAVVCGILSVWFNKQEKILVYPFGMVSVIIFIYLTYKYGLYAETGINVYYFIMSVYGWWNWKNTKDLGASQIPITKTRGWGHAINVSTLVFSFILIYFFLTKFTDSNVPILDSMTTSLAVTGMYLMALKKVEHWLFWIACDLISIPLYIYKGLPFTSFQFLVFTYLAVIGWISWRRKLIMNEN